MQVEYLNLKAFLLNNTWNRRMEQKNKNKYIFNETFEFLDVKQFCLKNAIKVFYNKKISTNNLEKIINIIKS